MLSSRIVMCKFHGQGSSYFKGWEEYKKNPYHKVRNPSGIIQMGLAENQLSSDILQSWLERNQDAITMIGRNGFGSMFRELALFQDYHGLPAFKKELVQFMSEQRQNKVRFDLEKLVFSAGATSANETIMFCLAGLGNTFLVHTPYYPGFDRDLKWRIEAEIVPIYSSSLNNFRITKNALEEAYADATRLNLRVKGVFITNPSNPLGTTLIEDEFNDLISFAIAKNIHIVSDEVYAGTVFDYPNFTSIIKALMDRHLENTEIWSRVHIVSSLSKDLGLPGFRVGMIYSNNQKLIAAATEMSSFGLVSSQTHYFLSKLLGDRKFTRNYNKENQKRLKNMQQLLISGLQNYGIKCLKSNAGLFCWLDMRPLLSSDTFDAENELWEKILYQVGLNISPGSSFHCTEPGWFRICFANMSEDTLKLSMLKIQAFFESMSPQQMKNSQ